MNLINIILSLGGALVVAIGAFFYQKNKSDILNVLVDNQNVQKDLNKQDKDISQNTGELQSEEAKRKQLQEDADKAKNEKNDSNDIVNFFNQRK